MEPRKTMPIKGEDINFYSSLISDYINGELKFETDWSYSSADLKNRLGKRPFKEDVRKTVAERINKQYTGLTLTNSEQASLKLFEQPNTHTITTGHQLMLLGGPLFFYTKIANVIALCKSLSTPEIPVVPIFWMASEDHDFEEISSVNLFGKTISCEGNNSGPVGRLKPDDFETFVREINELFAGKDDLAELKDSILECFSKGRDLAHITRLFVRSFFKDEGLLIVDGDDKVLKQLFVPVMEEELNFQSSFKSLSKTNESFKNNNYKIQVEPRTINLFFITNTCRERILLENGGYKTVDGENQWTKEELLKKLKDSPESFSPNVILRPVYQETILPNIAYVGGAGEIAYWLQLRDVFRTFKTYYPLPIIRKSYVLIASKQLNWLQNQDLSLIDLFGDFDILLNRYTQNLTTNEISLGEEIKQIKSIYQSILKKGLEISPQLEKVVLGDEKRAISSIQNVEKRFLNAEKQNLNVAISKLKNIRSKILPHNTPMERHDGFLQHWVNPKNNLSDLLQENHIDFTSEILTLIY